MVDKSEKFSWLVRVGYFSRAILYSVLGLIALTNASKITEGTQGIFLAIQEFPGGKAILWLMVVGLAAYAAFRFCSLLFDIENNGSDKKGWAKRIGHAASGIAHLVLAWSAFVFANSDPGMGSGSSGGAQEAASGILSFEFGGVALTLMGIAFFATAIYQAKKGLSGDFMHRISEQAPGFTRWLGGAGYCSRGVVYTVIGWSLIKASVLSGGAEKVKTLGDAVASLADQGPIFTLTAIGLLLFGLFSLVLAWYRIIPELDSDAGVPKFRN